MELFGDVLLKNGNTINYEILEKLIEILNNNYNMSEEDPVHMFRIFEATPTFDNEEKTFLTVRGYCAWSVYSCMMEGFGTYYNDCYKGTNATTIDRLAKDLNLYIEIISEEPGMCFMEHIVCFPNGDKIYESVPWYEFDIEEYDTFENFKKDEEMKPFDTSIFDQFDIAQLLLYYKCKFYYFC